jgi:hypothetical protein
MSESPPLALGTDGSQALVALASGNGVGMVLTYAGFAHHNGINSRMRRRGQGGEKKCRKCRSAGVQEVQGVQQWRQSKKYGKWKNLLHENPAERSDALLHWCTCYSGVRAKSSIFHSQFSNF